MSDTTFDDMVEREQFLELIAAGVSPVNAGVEVNWSWRQTKKHMSDPDFKELVEMARERADGAVEYALHAVALRGNVAAIAMWLYNRQPDRWRDIKRIEVKNDVTVSLAMVESVKAGGLALLREKGAAAMQELNAGSTIVDEIVDAEIVEDE